MAFAILVLPIPGSPYNIIENIFLFLTIFEIILSLPIKCSCPITSFKDFGASLSASGFSILINSFQYLFYYKFELLKSVKKIIDMGGVYYIIIL